MLYLSLTLVFSRFIVVYLSVISFVFIFYETHRNSQISSLMNSYELLCLPILYLPHYLLFLIHGFQSYFSFFRSYCGLLQFHSFCSLEKEMTAHSSILAWKIPWTAEPGRLLSMGSQRVRHDWGKGRKMLLFKFYLTYVHQFFSFVLNINIHFSSPTFWVYFFLLWWICYSSLI